MDWFPAVRLVISLYPYMDTCAESISVTKKGLAYKKVRTIILSIVFVMLTPQPYLHCEEGAASEEVTKGDALYGQTRLRDSLAHYKRALINKPSADVYFKIGMVYMNLSKTLLAEEFFLQAIGLNNEYAPAYKALGEIYVERLEAGQAQKAFSKAQELFSKAGDLPEAILCKWCEKAVDYIGTAGRLQRETLEEKKELLKMAQTDADKKFIETLFRKFQDVSKEPQKILYSYELAAKQTYFKYPQALCKLGTALTECGRYAEAIKEFKTALSLRPEYRDARYFLALAYEKDGQYRKAEATLMEVLITDPRCPYAYKELARCYINKDPFETSERLENLPSEAKFPDYLKGKIRYDAGSRLLVLKGVMTKEEKKRLLELSQNDSYKISIKSLFKKSRSNKTRNLAEENLAEENLYKAGLLFLEERNLLFPEERDLLFPEERDIERNIEEATLCLMEIKHLPQGKSSVLYKRLKRKIDQERLCTIGQLETPKKLRTSVIMGE